MAGFGTFFLPGPTEVRPDVLAAMMQPMIAHRGAAFEALFARLQAGLRPVFRTGRPVYVGTASATGFMEMAIRATPPGPVVSCVNGAFSERFADIAEACGRAVHRVAVPWGAVVSPRALDDALAAMPADGRAVAVTVVHSETSTGALHDVARLAEVARAHGAFVLVDSVTGLGGAPVESDVWGLDFVLTGSQKALALPPGLAFACASSRFVEAAARGEARGRYFDLLEYEANATRHQTPCTPALSLLYALDVQLAHIAREGIEARWARHAAMAAQTHAWVAATREALGVPLGILAPAAARSPTVTTITLPPALDGAAVVDAVRRRGFVIGGGYGKLKASTIRVGHMGDHEPAALARCLDAVRDAIASLADVSPPDAASTDTPTATSP